jgi:hypothetical protein
MIEPAAFSTPELHGAYERVRAFVGGNVAPGVLDQHALQLAGEPQEVVNKGIDALRLDMKDEMLRHDPAPSQAFATACSFVFAELIRERVHKIAIQGTGRA